MEEEALQTPRDIPRSGSKPVSRRDFLATALLSGGAAVLAATPIVFSVVIPALKKGVGRWVDFGAADKLPADGFSMLSYEFMVKDGWLDLPQRGFVWARGEAQNAATVFSSTCTHLACNVIWNPGAGFFECPCHTGRFGADGQPVSGPPKKPLNRLPHKIEAGKLLVHITI